MIYFLYNVHEGGSHQPRVPTHLPLSHREAEAFFSTEAENQLPFRVFGDIRAYVIYRDVTASVRPDEVECECDCRTAAVKAMALYEEIDERALNVDPMRNYAALEGFLEEMLLGKSERLFCIDRFPFLTYQESLRIGPPPSPKVADGYIEKPAAPSDREKEEAEAGPSWGKAAPALKRVSPGAAKVVGWTCTILALAVLLALLELNLKIDYPYEFLRITFTFKVTTLVERALIMVFGGVIAFPLGFACCHKQRKE